MSSSYLPRSTPGIASRALPAIACCLAACGALLSAGPASAAWPHDPNVNLAVCTAPFEQVWSTAVSDGAGGMIVTWHDLRNGASHDIYAQHVLFSGGVDPNWPAGGLLVCGASSYQQLPVICSDLAGGAIIAWHDIRSGIALDIYAQHVFASGVVDPMWPTDGRALCTASGAQAYPQIVSDGAGGAIVTWQDQRSMIYDIYAQHVLAYGAVDMLWPANGRALCTATGEQLTPRICSDGAGGAIVAWTDIRSGTDDVYAQHVQASGGVDPFWAADGNALSTIASDQYNPVIESDGAGGALVAWEDNRNAVAGDIYVTHVLASGTLHWASNGVALCTAANEQFALSIARDGANGVLLAWMDNRSGATSYDIYVHHVLATGIDAGWPLNGRAVCTATNAQQYPNLVSDGAGGAIAAWQDFRGAGGLYAQHVFGSGTVDATWPVDGRALSTAASYSTTAAMTSDGAGGAIAAWSDGRSGSYDLFAQRVGRFGYLGTPEAEIAGVTDVPNDQGGRVKVSWNASWLDRESDPNLYLYEVWRSVPGSVAEAAIRAGSRRLSGFAERPAGAGRSFVSTAQGYWEYLGSQAAVHYIPGYAYLAPTTGDSTGDGNATTAFMVVARNASGSMYWLSSPVSGYSVDNLAPIAPSPFTGQYAAGATRLHWNPNGEADLAGYRLYRGTSPEFVPGPGNQIATLADTGYVDAAGLPYAYKLSAVDSHGNESGFTLLVPVGLVSVEGEAAALALARPSPNPAFESASIRWSLPAPTAMRLAVFDAAGRRLRSLVEGMVSSGPHEVRWDLRDDRGGRVASGICFVRLTLGDRVLVQRIAVLK
jgi:hypothetical protein